MNFLIRKTLFNPFAFLLNNQLKFSISLLNVKPNKKPQVPFKKWTIVRGDVVKVIAGKDKGKIGKVTRVWRKSNSITVKGINIKIKRISNFPFNFQNHQKELQSLKEKLIPSMYQMLDCMIVKQKKLSESDMDSILKQEKK